MTLQELYNKIINLNEAEIFYKNFHKLKEDKIELQKLINSIDSDFLKRNYIRLDIIDDESAHKFEEDWFFIPELNNDILLQKHNCYNPPFCHYHNFFEMIYVLDGECNNVVSNYPLHMTAGDLCIIPPNIKHTISVFDEKSIVINILIKNSTFEDIFFNLLRSNNILSSFFLNNIYSKKINDYIIFHTNKDKDLSSLIMDLFLEYENKSRYYREVLNSQLISFFARMLRRYENNCELPPSFKKGDMKSLELIRYMHDNYQNITLNSVAEEFHYTPQHTSRLIKSTTGYTYTQLLKEIRLERAKSLLRDTSITIQDICTNVGYLNPEHFIRTFKRDYGMTPSEYRRIQIKP